MDIKVDESFQAAVLQIHGEHIGNIVAALVEKLTTVEPTFLKQTATKAERARLLEELAALQKTFEVESGLFSGRITSFLQGATKDDSGYEDQQAHSSRNVRLRRKSLES
jgi:hypothetical protein